MLAHRIGLGVEHRHGVLQLVTEADGAARLVVAAAREKAAGDHLVQQPSVDQHVERGVGRAHLHRAQRTAPVLAYGVERGGRRAQSATALHQRAGGLGALGHAQAEDDFTRVARAQIEGNLDGRAGVQRRADLPG